MKRTNNHLLGLAVAGILIGTTTSSCSGKADAAGGSVAAKEKNSCKGPGGCGAKDGKEQGCGGKNGCKAELANVAKHECKGHNECKGQGGCAAGDNGCAAKNSCKGHGGCAVPMKQTSK